MGNNRHQARIISEPDGIDGVGGISPLRTSGHRTRRGPDTRS